MPPDFPINFCIIYIYVAVILRGADDTVAVLRTGTECLDLTRIN